MMRALGRLRLISRDPDFAREAVMIRFRLSILRMMLLIALVGLAVFALKEGTPLWSGISAALVATALLGAILNTLILRGVQRAAWGGFALFGWAFLLWSFNPLSQSALSTPRSVSALLGWLDQRIHPKPEYVPNPQYNGALVPMAPSGMLEPPLIVKPGSVGWKGDPTSYQQIGHCYMILFFGCAGAAWATAAYARRGRSET